MIRNLNLFKKERKEEKEKEWNRRDRKKVKEKLLRLVMDICSSSYFPEEKVLT